MKTAINYIEFRKIYLFFMLILVLPTNIILFEMVELHTSSIFLHINHLKNSKKQSIFHTKANDA